MWLETLRQMLAYGPFRFYALALFGRLEAPFQRLEVKLKLFDHADLLTFLLCFALVRGVFGAVI